jgi:alpha-1,2-mannosyltransferase
MRAVWKRDAATGGRIVRAAFLIFSGVVAGIAVHALLYPNVHTVYGTYAEGARAFWAGRDLYPGPLPNEYRYSPSFALAFSPFVLLPDRLGNALWKIANGCVLAVGLRAFARSVVPAPPSPRLVSAVALLGLPAALISLYDGQANLVMVGAMLLGLEAAVRERWNVAALFLAAATLVKGYPLALALLVGALWPRRLWVRLPAALGLGLLLPFGFRSPAVAAGQLAQWIAQLGGTPGVRKGGYRSFDMLWSLVAPPLSAPAYLALSVATGATVLALCLLYARKTPSPRARLSRTYQLFSVWVVLFGPSAEAATYAVVGPAIAWAVLEAFAAPRAPVVRALLVTSLLSMGPLATDLVGPSARIFLVNHGVLQAGALLFLGVLTVQTLRGARA